MGSEPILKLFSLYKSIQLLCIQKLEIKYLLLFVVVHCKFNLVHKMHAYISQC